MENSTYYKGKSLVILMADDDSDDAYLAQRALKESKVINTFKRVCNGEELLKYLRRDGKYTDEKQYPWPSVILLDLNMPVMNGKETLEILKKDEKLSTIPVVVLTTSKAERDIMESYKFGANSYIVKPVDISSLIEMIKKTANYWLEVVKLPK